jgi:tetratricopeptide (TPR) repeat protein
MRIVGKALALIALFVLGSSLALGQLSAEEQKEDRTAESLYQAQNFVAALPLFENLHKSQPASVVYAERLAMSLIGSVSNHPPDEQPAVLDRARKLLLEAKAAGDNSNLLQIMLEKLGASSGPAPSGASSPGADAFQRAEKAFSSGKLSEAVAAYQEAFAADPKMYEAPLYAGDSEFKQGHYKEADEWYAKVVAVNPDRETAYRYWGDCLMKQGDTTQAEGKFIDAIVADPYSRTPRIGLKQWADSTGAIMMAPAITLPARPTVDANGKTNITIDASATLAYTMGSSVWRGGMFQKAYPNEKEYRHSLAEEAQSIRVALSTLAKVKPDKMDVTWRTLAELDKDGMLECWILLDRPDQGIAQDYVAYRAAHRDLLHAYIAKYDVHPK